MRPAVYEHRAVREKQNRRRVVHLATGRYVVKRDVYFAEELALLALRGEPGLCGEVAP